MKIKQDMLRLFFRFLISCLFFILIAACSTAPTATPTLEPTAIPTDSPTNTPEPTSIPTDPPTNTPEPTITPSPEPEEIIFEVTFDGSECTIVSSHDEVPLGNISVAFDQGDRNFGPWVDHFLEGKTFEDFLDEIHVGPEVSHPKPDWVEYPFYFTKDYEVWSFTLKHTGEHAIFLGSYTPWREYPCGSFQVVEAPSE